MTTLLLSQHSSNPFDVSSDNQAYRKAINEAGGRRPDVPSSDDLCGREPDPSLTAYWSHIGGIKPGLRTQQSLIYGRRASAVTESMIEADEDMVDLEDSSDDLTLGYDEDAENVTAGNDVDVDEDEDTNMEDVENSDDIASSNNDHITGKDAEEEDEIRREMVDLQQTLPNLRDNYQLLGRLGTGTFSSVYKAVDLHYHEWNNTFWLGHHPPESSARFQSTPHTGSGKFYVAIKRIYVTSSPERIRNEINVMEDCRGCRHVSQLITAFRKEDQVVAIMPYQRNEDFREFYTTLSMDGIKEYLRCLFRGLRDIHARGIIHRDIKPANFLYDPRTGRGTICDFGLASRVSLDSPSSGSTHRCLHTPATRKNIHGILRTRNEYDANLIKTKQREARSKNAMASDNVGYPMNDNRPPSKANRAGTRGFRAPEVLLKCNDQSGAIDIWSAGVMLLLFLTGKFPLFNSGDDTEALLEIATLMGTKRMEKVATLHSRTISTNIPSISATGMPWRDFCTKQNLKLEQPPKPNPLWYPHATEAASREDHIKDLAMVFDLVEQLMHPESIHRITARNALYHPFLHEDPGDDEFFPHPFGQGACSSLHGRDESGTGYVTKEIDGMRMMRLVESGEGIAIGNRPCEFHDHDN